MSAVEVISEIKKLPQGRRRKVYPISESVMSELPEDVDAFADGHDQQADAGTVFHPQ